MLKPQRRRGAYRKDTVMPSRGRDL